MEQLWHCCDHSILEVIPTTIAVVISLRAALISFFLDFPNAESVVFIFYYILTCIFIFNSLKTWQLCGTFHFLCFINPCRIWACVIIDCCSKYNLIMLLTCSLIIWSGVRFLNSSCVASSNPLKQFADIPTSLKLPITLEKSEGAQSCDG